LSAQVERDKSFRYAEVRGDGDLCRPAGIEGVDLTQLGGGQLLTARARDVEPPLRRRVLHVVGLRAEKQVRWIDADRVVAAMQDAHPVRDRAMRQQVGVTMGVFRPAVTTSVAGGACYIDAAIAVWPVLRSEPGPAVVTADAAVHPGPESTRVRCREIRRCFTVCDVSGTSTI